jgi:hypothetical protein
LTEQREDPAKAAQRARQQKLLSELWPLRNPVRYESEQDLYSRIYATFETFWDPPDERYFHVGASVVLFSYRIRQFNSTPYPFLYGPKDSGKSRFLDLLRLLCYNPLKSSSLTSAAIYQSLNTWHPTLLADETDKWGLHTKTGPSENVLAILSVLNSGYRRGDMAIRASREGAEPIIYDLFGLKVIAGTMLLPDTLMDRCIVLEMSHNVKDIPLEIDEQAIETLRGQLEMYYRVYDLGRAATEEGIDDQGNPIVRSVVPQPTLTLPDPEELKAEIGDNRVTELFYPLYAVCPTVEGRKALLELAKEAVLDRSAERETGDLSKVLEAVIETWQLSRVQDIPVRDILAEYNRDVPEKEQITSKTLGWKLNKLHMRKERLGDTTRTRAVRVDPKKLYRLARLYSPRLAQRLVEVPQLPLETTETVGSIVKKPTVPTVSSGESLSSGPNDPETVRSPDPSQAAVSPENTGEPSEQELALVQKAMRELQERQSRAPIETLRYKVREESRGMIDAERLTRIMIVMAKRGELEADGADCFKLSQYQNARKTTIASQKAPGTAISR